MGKNRHKNLFKDKLHTKPFTANGCVVKKGNYDNPPV